MLKIELGCGKKEEWRPGYSGIDSVDYGQPYIRDIEIDGLPFDDGDVDEIYASHFLEHVDFIKVMNECWRVLKKDGELYAICPTIKNPKAFIPVHKNLISEYTFRFFEDQGGRYGVKPWIVREIVVNERGDVHAKLTPKK